MDNIKNDDYYVKRLIKSIEVTTRYLKNKSIDDLISDGFLCDAIENRFTKIAEDASKLSKEFKDSLAYIPWDGIASIRNRVCHNYDVVDASTLYKTIKINFPEFKLALLSKIGFHVIAVDSSIFNLIKTNKKIIDVLLYKKEYESFEIGELIVYQQDTTKEELIIEVLDLKIFKTIDLLLSHYKKTEIGDIPYSTEDIYTYGLLAIRIRVY